MSHNSFQQLDDLAKVQTGLIMALREVKRALFLPHKDEYENDVDHSFGLAMSAWFMADYLDLDLDHELILKYALVHDMVEIHADDTFLFADDRSRENKAEREAKSLKQIEEDWSDLFPNLIETIHDYKSQHNLESRFVYSLDKILPGMLVHIGEGHKFWNRHQVTYEEFAEENIDRIAESKHLKHLAQAFCDWIGEKEFYDEGST